MDFTHLQIERNPWLGGYRLQIPILSALCPQLNLLNLPNKIPGYATGNRLLATLTIQTRSSNPPPFIFTAPNWLTI
jgi:hypothetical protein